MASTETRNKRNKANEQELPENIKKTIEEEIDRVWAIDNPHPNMFTAYYVCRDVLGKADAMAIAEYASQALNTRRLQEHGYI